MQKLEFEFKLPKLDMFFKIKPDSCSMYKYDKFKLWHPCEIYLAVHDGNYEFDFYDKISNE